jgi:hypothetical protein
MACQEETHACPEKAKANLEKANAGLEEMDRPIFEERFDKMETTDLENNREKSEAVGEHWEVPNVEVM